MKKTITFRDKVLLSDAETVRRLTKSTGFFEQVFDEIDCAVEEVEAALEGGAGTSNFLFLEIDGVAEAFISYYRQPCCDSLYYASWLCVNNSLRGMGLGKAIMNEFVERIWKLGGRKILLQTSGRPQYLPTRAFYEKYGFKIEAEIPDFYTVGESTVYYGLYNPNLPVK